jgi:hypothetical protein
MNATSTNTLIFAVVLIVAVGAIVAWVLMLEVKPTSTAHISTGPISVHS